MVSEVPPERPNIRVSPAAPYPPPQTQAGDAFSSEDVRIFRKTLACPAHPQTPVGRQGGTGTRGRVEEKEVQTSTLTEEEAPHTGLPISPY